MSWIKRNIFFAIFSVVGLALMGLAGWFLYSKYSLNNQTLASVNALYTELKDLKTKRPHPGDAKVNNIQIAKDQQLQLSNYVAGTKTYFAAITRIPSPDEAPKITDRDFTTALSRTIDQLHKDAQAASVNLNSNYNFSFEAERQKVQFDSKGLIPLATQLGEVKTICDILFHSKINSLENIRRERVAPEDSLGGLQTDYLTEKRTTNEMAVLTPYEVVFKCFSSELASVLTGLGSSSSGFIIKTINVEGAPIAIAQEAGPNVAGNPIYIPAPQPTAPVNTEAEARARMAARYGLGGGGRYGGGAGQNTGVPYRGIQPQAYNPPPVQTAAQPSASRSSGGLPTILDERQLKVTVNLILVKLIPAK